MACFGAGVWSMEFVGKIYPGVTSWREVIELCAVTVFIIPPIICGGNMDSGRRAGHGGVCGRAVYVIGRIVVAAVGRG